MTLDDESEGSSFNSSLYQMLGADWFLFFFGWTWPVATCFYLDSSRSAMGLGDIEGEVFWSTATALWGTISWLWPAGFWPRKRCRSGRESATQSRGQGAAGQPGDLGTDADTFVAATMVSALRGNVQRSGSGGVMWSRCFSRCQKLLVFVLEVGASIESWILQGQPRAFYKVASFVAWGCCC